MNTLMTAIKDRDVPAVTRLLKPVIWGENVSPYKKEGTQTPLELAHQIYEAQPDNQSARIIKQALIECAFSGRMLDTIRDTLKSNIIAFIDDMRTYTDNAFIVGKLLMFCAERKDMELAIQRLIRYPWSLPAALVGHIPNPNMLPADFLKHYPQLLNALITHYRHGADEDTLKGTLPVWITWCLDHGAPINMPDDVGWTPLLAAIEGDDSKVVEILLNRGADLHYTTEFGFNAITLSKNQYKAMPNDAKELIKQLVMRASDQSSFTINKAFFATLIASVATYGLYNWFFGKTSALEQKNVLVNKTGSEVLIAQNARIETLTDGASFDLPENGTITISTPQTEADTSKHLICTLEDYEDDLQDWFINITITARSPWLVKYFNMRPITSSVSWTRKVKQQKTPSE